MFSHSIQSQVRKMSHTVKRVHECITSDRCTCSTRRYELKKISIRIILLLGLNLTCSQRMMPRCISTHCMLDPLVRRKIYRMCWSCPQVNRHCLPSHVITYLLLILHLTRLAIKPCHPQLLKLLKAHFQFLYISLQVLDLLLAF